MNTTQISLLSESELLLLREAERPALATLDEDEVGDLLLRVRRARNKYAKNYRRQSTKRVTDNRSRGAARGSSNKTAIKAEIFEDALARVSRRLSVLARERAKELRRERIESARGAPPAGAAARGGGGSPKGTRAAASAVSPKPSSTKASKGTRGPAKTKQVRSSQAAGARRQAKRDNR
jgi:hypothetical protein